MLRGVEKTAARLRAAREPSENVFEELGRASAAWLSGLDTRPRAVVGGS